MTFFSGLTLLLLVVSSPAATAPIASVFSTGSFLLSGVPVDMTGVLTWPLFDGDEITAGSSNAVVLFPRGDRITLVKGSKIQLSRRSGLEVHLLEGTFYFALPTVPRWTLLVPDRSLPSAELDGVRVSVQAGKAVIERADLQPVVEMDRRRLLRRFPWTLGVYSPAKLP